MKTFTIIDAEQRSDAWRLARAGRVTASRASDVLAKIKSGEAAARRNYKTQIVAERLTGQPQDDGFVTSAMVRGIELEPQALAAYEAATGQIATRVGFLAHNELPIGASPDGVVGDYEGIVELKVPNPATHVGYLRGWKMPTDYVPQVMHLLLVTGAAYCDFLSYGPNFPTELQTFIVRVHRADLDLDGYERDLRLFIAEVETELASLRTMANVGAVLREAVA